VRLTHQPQLLKILKRVRIVAEDTPIRNLWAITRDPTGSAERM